MAISAAAWLLIAREILNLPINLTLILLVFSSALAVYNLDRLHLVDESLDQTNVPKRTRWIANHQILLFSLTALALALLLILTFSHYEHLAGFIITVFVFGVAYALPFIHFHGHYYSFKSLPFFKMIFVATLWVSFVVGLPLLHYQTNMDANAIHLLLAIAGFVMVQVTLNDLRDIKGDKAHHVLSLPVVVGPCGARMICVVLTMMATYFGAQLAAIPFIILGIYTLILVFFYNRKKDYFWRPWIELQALPGLAVLFI
ncbi:MAG: UbiA family prenyltransferase [Gammaproteobacteria bacterium]